MVAMRFKAPVSGFVKATVTIGAIASVGAVVAMPLLPPMPTFAAWYGYGGNAQHTGVSKFTTSGLGSVKWSVPIDEDIAAESSGPDVLIHYASPCITGIDPISGNGNTVVVAVHNNKGGNHDSWRIEGLDGSHGGKLKWSYDTDYSAPITMPTDWTSVYPLSLTSYKTVVAAGGGGTVLVIPDADVNGPVTPTVLNFYGKPGETYPGIKISTPITADTKGNFFFGYRVVDTTGIPSKILAKVGTGGIVKFNIDGKFTLKNAGDLISGGNHPSYNCAPVFSNDFKSVYVGIVASSGCYLLKLNATDPGLRGATPTSQTLAVQASVQLKDPYTNSGARTIAESSASPMVAPDGHVFMGVFGSNWRESHGWNLQFDANLNQYKDAAKTIRYPVGAFGWDDTASVVPASAVPSYHGAASYLILSKYNNYYMGPGDGGNGRNELALLDPTESNTTDWQSGIKTMTKVQSVLGVTCDSSFYACTPTTDVHDPSVPVREWCINAAAIDVANKCAIVNSEDGHAYKWNFVTGSLENATYLQPATGEAYTCTSVGPDGTSYAINNGVLHAVVAPLATRP